MEVHGFYVPFLESFKLQDSYNSDFKGLFESRTNISNAPNKILLLKSDFFKKRFLHQIKKKNWSKYIFQ